MEQSPQTVKQWLLPCSKRNPEASGTNKRMKTEPQSGTRPVVTMMLHHGNSKWPIRVLLDSGSSVPVLSSDKAEQWKIDTYTRQSHEP
ncbi:hypothetical protein DID88_000723 [Monilinia fructigena]|uniref:Uncharacterized protein n=1 Tax=Monilinia fructigena TaxID=38457 RepID=A0A395IKP5_9HELO|nr:hypothetical protein DID88_000723 [Monilinia fructigena]